MDKAEAEEVIRGAGLGTAAQPLIERLLPSIGMVTRLSDAQDLQPGASRMGGDPDLPEGFDWPVRSNGQVLSFLVQINLSDLPNHDFPLPSFGWLCVFYDDWGDDGASPWGGEPGDEDALKVVHFEAEPSELIRMPYPGQYNEGFTGWKPCSMEFEPRWTLPGMDEISEILDEHEDEDDEQEIDPWDICEEVCSNGLAGREQGDGLHQMFGHPFAVQGHPLRECLEAMDEPIEAASDWVLLMQIDTDEPAPGWMWGDVGAIYICIHKDDLAAGNFSNCRYTLQCG
ncbi:MAG: YwqG family protein [Planctomycetota bacterium]